MLYELRTYHAVPGRMPDLLARYTAAGGTFLVCPICVDAKGLRDEQWIDGATIGGTVPMWEWIGDEGATTFSY